MFGSPYRLLYIYSITTRGKNRLPYTYIMYISDIYKVYTDRRFARPRHVYNNITAGVHRWCWGGSIVRLFRAFSFVYVWGEGNRSIGAESETETAAMYFVSDFCTVL